MAKKAPTDPAIATNRKARFRYEILEKLECGIVLGGSEVKSLRDGHASIEEAYCRIERGELWLIGVHISPYSYARLHVRDPNQRRKLLIHKSELRKLIPKVEQKGLTLIPLKLYFNERGIAKVTVGLARGKTHSDKRQSMKKRDHKREMDRATKRR